MKDGARLVVFECQGPDLNSASSEEHDARRALANRAFLRLDEGFAYQMDQIRHDSAPRPKRVLADPVSSMIDHEGALHYTQEGRHHESRTVITIAWRPPSAMHSRAGRAFVTGGPAASDRERQREWFKQQLQEFPAAINPVWKLARPAMSVLLSHITSCINGRMCQVKDAVYQLSVMAANLANPLSYTYGLNPMAASRPSLRPCPRAAANRRHNPNVFSLSMIAAT
ncbi:MAG: hypothetical protein ABSG46_11360 [Candidatus Binataceae bacterium]|jgi:hypothetical protein